MNKFAAWAVTAVKLRFKLAHGYRNILKIYDTLEILIVSYDEGPRSLAVGIIVVKKTGTMLSASGCTTILNTQ